MLGIQGGLIPVLLHMLPAIQIQEKNLLSSRHIVGTNADKNVMESTTKVGNHTIEKNLRHFRPHYQHCSCAR